MQNYLYIQTVEKVFAEHTKEVEKISKMGAYITVSKYENTNCKNKADIYIEYCCQNIRVKVEKFIGNTFFGVPYRMRNT